MVLSEKIVKLRKNHGLSQSGLAKLAKVSQAFISDVESGKKNPTVDTLENICSALGVTLVEFFDDKESPALDKEDPYLHQWIKVGESLSPQKRKSLLQMIDTLIEE